MKLSTSKSPIKKTYKALVLDVDGTIMLDKIDGIPSKKVTRYIKKASKLIHVSIATSRPYFDAKHIIEHLDLKSPCIILGGAQIFDPKTNKMIWEKLIGAKDIEPIFKIAKRLKIEITDDGTGKDKRHERINLKDYKNGSLEFWIHGIDVVLAEQFTTKLLKIPTISALKVPSRKTNKIDVIITHINATKHHGINELAKHLTISTNDMIAVGDGHNDLPLLMACGLKIAMGNANKELKAIAHYIAPNVEDDGVAHIIKKFIL